MIRIAVRCRDAVRRNRNRTRALRPAIEGLEDRKLLSTVNGGKWTYPVLVTYSFMPDGTHIGDNIGAPTSNMYATLNAVAPTATWQAQFQKAAAIWQQVANINIAQVPDNGDPFGGNGYQQGDSRYGDIRIGGYAMTTSMATLAMSILPPPINGGSSAGDILLNTALSWNVNSTYDLLTVAIHEIGHSLGMGHSAVEAADMYANYPPNQGMKQTLHTDDTGGIQSIYGSVPADTTPNNSTAAATDLTSSIQTSPLHPEGVITFTEGYVSSLADVDYYKVIVPSTTSGSMTVTMQSTGLSSLSPRFAILNAPTTAVGQAMAQYKYGATVSYTLSGVLPGQVYYIRTTSAQNGPGWNGAFGLQINFGTNPLPPIAPPNTAVFQKPSQGGGSLGETFHPNRRHQAHRGHGQFDHDQVVLDLGETKAVADLLLVSRRRHPRPSRFRHA